MRPATCTAARSRAAIALTLALVILAGFLSRTVGAGFGQLIAKDAGDVLWGAMFYLLLTLARPRAAAWAAAGVAFAIASATELLKLYHAAWIDALRSRPVTGMLLGRVFALSNFAAYAAGAAVAAATDLISRRRSG